MLSGDKGREMAPVVAESFDKMGQGGACRPQYAAIRDWLADPDWEHREIPPGASPSFETRPPE